MVIDPRIEELLSRYPDQLDDTELEELRSAAALDPSVDALMETIHGVEATLLDGPGDSGTVRGPRAWSTRGTTPGAQQAQEAASALGLPDGLGVGANAGPVAWSTRGATPTARVETARRRVHPGFLGALAAAFVLFIGVQIHGPLVKPYPPVYDPGGEFGLRGPDVEPSGVLWVMGEQRIISGTQRPADQPVTFTAVVAQETWLVLAEVQGGKAAIVFPPPGETWQVPVGSHLLQPGGAAASYQPAAPGPATYVLLGAIQAVPTPTGPFPTLEALTTSASGLHVLDQVELQWSTP